MKQMALSFLLLVFSVAHSYGLSTLKTTKWKTVDLSFKLNKEVAHPFQVELNCEFTAQDGSKIRIPGFYNGSNEWIVRFNPTKEGSWTAVSTSSVQNLNGKKYTIKVGSAEKGKHGGVKISTRNVQRLSYEDDTPYNMLAFEADWLFALDYGNADLPKTKQLIEAIQSNGFNQIIMNVYAYDVSWEQGKDIDPKYNFGSRKNIFPFLGDNDNPDYAALNVAFFKHFDRVIELLEENGIVAHIMIYVWNKKVNWPESNSVADNMYFDYVVKRYQAKNNILWDISKEALGYGHDDMNYISERIERLRNLDAYDRLVTVHDYTYCSENPEKVDMISVQFWYTDIYSDMLEMKNKFSDKPILNIEHGGYEKCQYEIFEGNYDSPSACLERNYKCAFAGTYSTYYWQGTSWNVVIYDPFSEDVSVQPKFEYYKHMREFLDKINYEELEPNKNYSASGYCLANDKDGEYVYYMPKDNSAMAVRRLPKSEKMQIQWFNPLTGAFSKLQEIDYKGWLMLYPEFEGIDNIVTVKLLNKIE
jgi:hypothetical protein